MLKPGRYCLWKTVSSYFYMLVRPRLLHRPSFLFDCFVKIWATCKNFLGKWLTANLLSLPPPPHVAKNSPYTYAGDAFSLILALELSSVHLLGLLEHFAVPESVCLNFYSFAWRVTFTWCARAAGFEKCGIWGVYFLNGFPTSAITIRQNINIASFIFLHRIPPKQSSKLNTL